MEILKNIWGWVKKNPGKALAGASTVAAAGGYGVAPWVNALIGVLNQAAG